MAHAEGKVAINRPVQDVFSFLLDGTHNPLWRPGVTDIERLTSLPDAVGATFKQGMKGPGGRIEGDYKIVDLQPNRIIQFQVIAGPARPTGTYLFEPSGEGTLVTFIPDYQAKGLEKLMEPMINKSMQSEVANLSNLKAYLESK